MPPEFARRAVPGVSSNTSNAQSEYHQNTTRTNPSNSHNSSNGQQQQQQQQQGGFGGGRNPMSMGMPYMMPGMMGGMGGMGNSNNPLGWIYSINQMIFSISYALDMIGMNSQAIQQLYHRLIEIYSSFLAYVKRSKVRKYLQEKSKKSKLFRIFIICCTMILTSQIYAFVKLNNSKGKVRQIGSGLGV